MRNIIVIVSGLVIVTAAVYFTYFFVGTDAWKARVFNYCTRNRVELYSGGKCVGTWHTTGKIQNEDYSDGYYFKSEETDGLVTVSGNVVVTALKEGQN